MSSEELHRLIGELRRKVDERHKENLGRFKIIESQIVKDREQLNQLTASVDKLTTVALESKESLDVLVRLISAAKIGRSTLIWIAGVLVAVGSIWGVILFFLGRGPLPPIHG